MVSEINANTTHSIDAVGPRELGSRTLLPAPHALKEGVPGCRGLTVVKGGRESTG